MALIDSPKNFLAVSLFTCLSLWGLSKAFNFGVASLDFYFVQNTLSLWQEKGDKQTLAQYDKAKTAIISATSHHPNHPTYVDLMAQIYEWGAIADFEDEHQSLLHAKELYLRAATMRPLWPVTWASLAMIKWRLQEFDDEMLWYLENANRLGPKKAEVNVLYANLGLALYQSNSPLFLRLKKDIFERIALGLRSPYSRSQVILMIKQYDSQKLVCRWLRNESRSIKRYIPNCI